MINKKLNITFIIPLVYFNPELYYLWKWKKKILQE